MSPDQPIGPTYNYNHVPKLSDLLPETSGIPGVEYAQVCFHNAKKLQDLGWGPYEGSQIYTIVGPKGSIDMQLVCIGNPIRGASSHEGARIMQLDHDIYRLTGLWLGEFPTELQEEFNIDEHGKELENARDESESNLTPASTESTPIVDTTSTTPSIATAISEL